MLDYKIIVPSRKRPHNMPVIQALLPSAFICIDEREIDDYLKVVPKEKLIIHPPMDGLTYVLNWAQDHIDNEILVSIDDDFVGVVCNVGNQRYITDPEEILAILENAMQCCHDLGLGVFCFSRTQNNSILHAEVKPIKPTQPVCNAFGIMNKARHRKYDCSLLGRADIDWVLRTLIEDRIVFADVRFYFDCGEVFAGRGGNVGLITPEHYEKVCQMLKERWGKSIQFGGPSWVKNKTKAGMAFQVKRTNRMAQK